MGQGHSKRYKAKRYQFEGEPAPGKTTGKQSRFTRKPQNVPQHLAQHSHQIAQNSQHAAQQVQYKRRSSQDYTLAQMRNEAAESRPRAVSWHESRLQPLVSAVPDVRSRMTGNYRPNVAHSTRRRETSYFASYEDDNVTSMGYYSMERRETNYPERDSSFAPASTRPETSEVTEVEIEALVEELRDSDWMRLGSHLGISASRLAAFRDHYHGNVPLCSMEALLLWKQNCSEVINPRSHLALALSTIGREDLYGKIKKRTYLVEADSRPSQNGDQRNRPRPNTVVILNDDDKGTTMNTERSLDWTESGVETIESLSDSLEGESDDDDEERNETGWEGDEVIHVPITISKDNETHPFSPKPVSITVPIVTTGWPKSSSPPPSSTPSAASAGEDTSSENSMSVVHIAEVDRSQTQSLDDINSVDQDQLEPDPATVTTRLEAVDPGETVSVAILKSFYETGIQPNEPSAASEEIQSEEIHSEPATKSERKNFEEPVDSSRADRVVASEGTGPPKSLNDVIPKSDATKVNKELSEGTDLPKSLNSVIPKSDATKVNTELSEGTDLPKTLNSVVPTSDVTKVNTELSEDELLILSADFRSSSEWRMLGKRLGISESEIKNLSKRNGEDATQCALGVLKIWKRRFGNAAKERRILAGVTSDLGRDDLYSAIINNKLVNRMASLEASAGRWQGILKERYMSPDFDAVNSCHYMDVHVVYREENGPERNLQCRHDILKAQKGKKQSPLILLHGDAGCGKTTLLKRLAQDWAEGNDQSPLSSVPLVLFLTVQEVRQCRSIGQAATRYLLFKDTATTPRMVDDYLRMYPENCALLIDGFDTSRSREELQAIQEIRGKVQCQVVATSRVCLPESDDPLRKLISVEMQDIGINQRGKFVSSCFESDEVRGKELLQYLQNDDVLSSFCSRPMFLATICQLWKDQAQLQDINTLSDVITSSIVLRFIGQEDVTDVVEGVSNVMSALSRVALESIMQPRIHLSFKTKDLADDERECAELAERVGLIRCSPSTSEDSNTPKENREWYFINPLVHEKCAAIRLASLHQSDPERFEDIISAIGTIAECESLKYILTFASGGNLDAAKRILRLLSDLAWKDPASRLKAQELALKCNFECHRNDALNRELQFSMRSLQIAAFSNKFMADISFRYFVLNSVREAENPVQLQKVQFLIESRADMDYATACLQNGYFTSVPEFIFEMPKTFSPSREASRRLSDDVISPSLRCLTVLSILSTRDFISNLHSSDSLEELRGFDIDTKYIDLPKWCLNYPNLKTLGLSCIMYQDPRHMDDHRNSLKGLETALCTLTKLESLQLSNFFCSETMVQIITKVLQTLPNLSHIQVGPFGEQLHHYSEEVEETCGDVTEATMQSFIKATKKSSSLKKLQLSCFGNFEKLYQLLRSETSSRGRRGSELHYTPPGDETGYWVFTRQ